MTSQQIEIEVATPADFGSCLALVFSAQPEATRTRQIALTLQMWREEKLSLDGLVVARCSGQVVGASWLQLLPGKTAILWPPRLLPDTAEEVSGRLIAWTDTFLCEHGVSFSQAIVAPDDSEADRRLREMGYRYVTDSLFLMCRQERFPSAPPDSELEFKEYRVEHRQRIGELIARTYQGSRDLSELSGVRDISDVLEEYEQTGEFHPELWRIVMHGDQDVGCLVMADHPRDNQLELVYMGLVPEARGNKWGTAIAKYAAWLTRQANRERLMLAVDATNLSALMVYQKVGFEIVNQRLLFLKVL